MCIKCALCTWVLCALCTWVFLCLSVQNKNNYRILAVSWPRFADFSHSHLDTSMVNLWSWTNCQHPSPIRQVLIRWVWVLWSLLSARLFPSCQTDLLSNLQHCFTPVGECFVRERALWVLSLSREAASSPVRYGWSFCYHSWLATISVICSCSGE